MGLFRIISASAYKGTRDYLDTQRIYECIRTILMFSISLSILAIGFLTTHTRLNLLTIVAVLGCLPASKSLVSLIMFCRFRSLKAPLADEFADHQGELCGAYDMVFTTNDKCYQIDHLVVKGNSICGYSKQKDFSEQAFQAHILPILKKDSFSNVIFKVFSDPVKYVERLDQLKVLSCDEKNTNGIMETLKSVSL